jgi:hypothetical protein
MANQMMVDVFLARARSLQHEATALGQLSHDGVLGTARELLLRALIAPLLPPDVEVLTGSIINSNGINRIERNQDDVVLFDHNRAPLLWSAPGCALIPIEGVVAQIEVKSTLNAGGVRDAVKAASEISGLAVGEAPPGLLFAYASDLSGAGKTELDRLLKAIGQEWHPVAGQATSPIQAICVVGVGCWILTSIQTVGQGWFFVPDALGMLAFVSVLSNYLYRARTGAGAYLLDAGWLQGPVVSCPLVKT